jgi:hypothetical protein
VIAVRLFAALNYVVCFLLAKHYPEEFGKLKPLAPGGMHDNPLWYLKQAHGQLEEAAKILEG